MHKLFLLFVLLAALPFRIEAQTQPTVVQLGGGCGSTLPIPFTSQLQISAPLIGAPFIVGIAPVSCCATSGSTWQVFAGIEVPPFAVGVSGGLPCSVYLDPSSAISLGLITIPANSPSNSGFLFLSIPNELGLLGYSLVIQAVLVSPSPTGALFLTSAHRITFGI